MTPDFAEWLLTTPEAERVGRVFKLVSLRGGRPLEPRGVGQVVSAIGRQAKVVVSKAEGKYASAHDLRRAFGNRWSKRVMPAVLKRLMRHADIGTTMAYYVDLDAAEVADQLWAAHAKEAGNIPGNRGPKAEAAPSVDSSAKACQ